MSVRDCVELERSNSLLHTENNDKKLLKTMIEEFQLKARLEKKITTKGGKITLLEGENFTQEIPDRQEN